MDCNDMAENLFEEMKYRPQHPVNRAAQTEVEYAFPEQHETLAIALHLLDNGDAVRADGLLTAATLEDPADPELWLATGICRLRRGAVRSASAAFEMAAWLSDDQDARDLHDLCSYVSM